MGGRRWGRGCGTAGPKTCGGPFVLEGDGRAQAPAKFPPSCGSILPSHGFPTRGLGAPATSGEVTDQAQAGQWTRIGTLALRSFFVPWHLLLCKAAV